MINLEYVEDISEELGEMVGAEFDKYAVKNDILCNYASFTFIAKDGDAVVGIVRG